MSTYTQKALAAASVLLFGVPTAALSHTNSIGYVGGGNGSVTFWYGNWHPGTTFNEGTLTLQGINGTNFSATTVNWTLLSSTRPDGLIDGTNYFTSDGSQLVAYGSNSQVSSTWQGVTFTGLAAGDYQFTYNAAGSPTVNWMPMDNVILSSTVSLSAAALSGDANQNGILDIYETGGTPPPPTLVSSSTVNNVVSSVAVLAPVSATTVTHTAPEDDGRQRVNRHTQTDVTTTSVTTTTTTPVTTDTYSDNSTVVTNGTAVVTTSQASTVATSHEYADFYGRVDQHEVMDKMGEGLQSLLNHEPTKSKEKVKVFSKNYYAWSQGENGYSGTSFIYGGGVEIDIKPTWTIGGQYNNVTLNLNGTDSTSKLLKSHYGVFNMFRGNTLSLLTNAGLAQNNYSVSRNVAGVFSNDSQTVGQEWWVSNRLFVHVNKHVTPFVGHTVRNYTRNAFTETGSSESARSVEGVNETYNVGEAGLRLETRFGGKKKNLFGLSVEGSYATDNAIEASATLDYKEIVSIQGVHQINSGVSNTAVSANVKFRF
jgi:hypothetical protein